MNWLPFLAFGAVLAGIVMGGLAVARWIDRRGQQAMPVSALRWPDKGDTSYDSVCRRAAIHRWVNSVQGWSTMVVPTTGWEDIHVVLISPKGERTRIKPGHWVVRRQDGGFVVSPDRRRVGAA